MDWLLGWMAYSYLTDDTFGDPHAMLRGCHSAPLLGGKSAATIINEAMLKVEAAEWDKNKVSK